MTIYAYKRSGDNDDWHKVGKVKSYDEVLPKGQYKKLEVTEKVVAFKDEEFGTQYLFLSTDKKFVKQLEIGAETSFEQLRDAIDKEFQTINNTYYNEKFDVLDDLTVAYNKAMTYKRD